MMRGIVSVVVLSLLVASANAAQVFLCTGSLDCTTANGGLSTFGPVTEVFGTRQNEGSPQSLNHAYATMHASGDVTCFGNAGNGGTCPMTDAVEITAGFDSFAATQTDGSVACWGGPTQIANCPTGVGLEITSIVSNLFAYAAISTTLNTLTCWGAASTGGDCLTTIPGGSAAVTDVYASLGAFAVRLADGEVICWGATAFGGDCDTVSGLSVTRVFAGTAHFLTLLSNGTAVCSGKTEQVLGCGDLAVGDIVQTFHYPWGNNVDHSAALFATGDVECYGTGPSCASVDFSEGITKVVIGREAGMALMTDGTLRCWGDAVDGGSGCTATGVEDVASVDLGFVVRTSLGSVVCYGSESNDEITIVPLDCSGAVPAGKEAVAIYSSPNFVLIQLDDGSATCVGSGSGDCSGLDFSSDTVTQVVAGVDGFVVLLEETSAPTSLPTDLPTELPTLLPTALPTTLPTSLPTGLPTTGVPTTLPTAVPVDSGDGGSGGATAPTSSTVVAPTTVGAISGGMGLLFLALLAAYLGHSHQRRTKQHHQGSQVVSSAAPVDAKDAPGSDAI